MTPRIPRFADLAILVTAVNLAAAASLSLFPTGTSTFLARISNEWSSYLVLGLATVSLNEYFYFRALHRRKEKPRQTSLRALFIAVITGATVFLFYILTVAVELRREDSIAYLYSALVYAIIVPYFLIRFARPTP